MGAYDKYSDCVVCGNPEPRCNCKQHYTERQRYDEWLYWRDKIIGWYKDNTTRLFDGSADILLEDFANYLLECEDEDE